jgi:threonine aldolase
MPKADLEKVRAKGAIVLDWNAPRAARSLVGEDEAMVRMVTSFATTQDDVDRFIDLLH